MFRVEFHLTSSVLNGRVACVYCKEKNIFNYVHALYHFKYECKNICQENCECKICQMTHAIFLGNDGLNIYVNQRCAKDYFFPSVNAFWGQNQPCFILKLKNDDSGYLYATKDSPAPAC